ncbi:3-hydroxyanthranilic acid dioxygenase [Xylariaceae sp. FL0804]|nr:3-hydroxyanthranilic acid dioxygenase [Xylariaceae sp. FL0804]
MLGPPVNLPKWLEENSHLLKPPVNNYCVYNEGFSVMIVGGPNARTDYHVNETPEWFYQHRGAMTLKVVDGEVFRDVVIREGDMFLLPAGTPHNPVRFAGTVGLVLEQQRPPGCLDRMRWYCQQPSAASSSSSGSPPSVVENKGTAVEDKGTAAAAPACGALVHEAAFRCTDLGVQIKAAIQAFMADDEARRCPRCGALADSVPRPGTVVDPNLQEG